MVPRLRVRSRGRTDSACAPTGPSQGVLYRADPRPSTADIVGRPDLEDTIRRLRAYSEAGADCLYAPGLRTREQIAAVVRAVAPKPLNVLIGFATELTVGELSALGVRRISVGGALARGAWAGFQKASRELLASGRFTAFAEAASGAELNKLFRP